MDFDGQNESFFSINPISNKEEKRLVLFLFYKNVIVSGIPD